jgi:hypothetical protein
MYIMYRERFVSNVMSRNLLREVNRVHNIKKKNEGDFLFEITDLLLVNIYES